MKTILVQCSEPRWTRQAIEEACVLARNSDARVILLRLTPVSYAGYLGTEFGCVPPTAQEWQCIEDYAATAEDYGVELSVETMQSISAFDAIMQAVDDLQADLLIAHFARRWIPFWHRFEVWRAQQVIGSRLITLDQPIQLPGEPLTIEMITHPPLADSLHRVR